MAGKPEPKPKTTVSVWRTIRNRFIAGLFVVLPMAITFALILWLYNLLYGSFVSPIAKLLLGSWYEGDKAPFFIENVYAPGIAWFLVGSLIFVAGMFFNSRLHRFMTWFLNNVPGVNMVYSIVNNVFDAIQRTQGGATEFKRVVLVEFPHPGMKAPAFVTSETVDVTTNQTILCVYVPTTPVPTSGYMLMVPETDVVQLDWDLQDTLQAIVSGGITAPKTVQYYQPALGNQNSASKPASIEPPKKDAKE